MKRGDVVLVQLPRPQGKPGHEQYGVRPAVVIQNDPELAKLSTTVVVPLTSQLSATRFENTLIISPTGENGLKVKSVALVHQLRAIDRQRINSTIGKLSSEDLTSLVDKLKAHLAL